MHSLDSVIAQDNLAIILFNQLDSIHSNAYNDFEHAVTQYTFNSCSFNYKSDLIADRQLGNELYILGFDLFQESLF